MTIHVGGTMSRQQQDQAKAAGRTVSRGRHRGIAMLLALPLLATAITGCEDTASSTETAQPAALVEIGTPPSAVVSETPSEEATPEALPSPEPDPTPTTTAPAPEPVPEPAPEPVPAPVAEPVAEPAPAPAPAPAVDQRYPYCKDLPSGLGNYRQGVDPEYEWYQDRDHDGIVCEF